MAVTIKRDGYGQVEPNHLSSLRTGQIHGQLPAADKFDQVENGMFMKYDYPNGEINLDGAGTFMLVYSEEKLYDERKQGHKDFVLDRKDMVDGEIYPRLLVVNIGDIYTTNMVEEADYSAGDTLAVDPTTGILSASGTDAPKFEVAMENTMPDMQPAVKLVCVEV